MTRFHLAQVNIGRFRAPIDDPIMEGFRTQLDPINALADSAPGFIWRLQTEDGNATAVRPYADDDRMAINLSVWESLDALQQFVYRTAHAGTLRDRSVIAIQACASGVRIFQGSRHSHGFWPAPSGWAGAGAGAWARSSNDSKAAFSSRASLLPPFLARMPICFGEPSPHTTSPLAV